MSATAHNSLLPLDLLTVDEAAQILRCHPRTLRNWIYAGKVRSYGMGYQVRVSAADLAQPREYVLSNSQKTDHPYSGNLRKIRSATLPRTSRERKMYERKTAALPQTDATTGLETPGCADGSAQHPANVYNPEGS